MSYMGSRTRRTIHIQHDDELQGLPYPLYHSYAALLRREKCYTHKDTCDIVQRQPCCLGARSLII